MKKTIDVNTGDVKGSNDSVILRSIAIGSCIAVAAYSYRNRAGAIAHIMLPGRSREASRDKNRYAADAIDELIGIMEAFGAQQSDLEICLVGAGNVLEKPDDTICQSNIDSVTEIIKEKNIPVRASVLGGIKRKSVMMDVAVGKINYTEGNGKATFLWQAGD